MLACGAAAVFVAVCVACGLVCVCPESPSRALLGPSLAPSSSQPGTNRRVPQSRMHQSPHAIRQLTARARVALWPKQSARPANCRNMCVSDRWLSSCVSAGLRRQNRLVRTSRTFGIRCETQHTRKGGGGGRARNPSNATIWASSLCAEAAATLRRAIEAREAGPRACQRLACSTSERLPVHSSNSASASSSMRSNSVRARLPRIRA